MFNDVVVIGAGFAGCSAARLLRSRGLKTALLEKECKNSSISKDTAAYLCSEDNINKIENITGAGRSKFIISEVDSMIFRDNKKEIEIEYPGFFIIDPLKVRESLIEETEEIIEYSSEVKAIEIKRYHQRCSVAGIKGEEITDSVYLIMATGSHFHSLSMLSERQAGLLEKSMLNSAVLKCNGENRKGKCRVTFEKVSDLSIMEIEANGFIQNEIISLRTIGSSVIMEMKSRMKGNVKSDYTEDIEVFESKRLSPLIKRENWHGDLEFMISGNAAGTVDLLGCGLGWACESGMMAAKTITESMGSGISPALLERIRNKKRIESSLKNKSAKRIYREGGPYFVSGIPEIKGIEGKELKRLSKALVKFWNTKEG